MSLAQLDLSSYDTPAAPVAEARPEPTVQDLVVLRRTRGGHLIAVCTMDRPPQAIANECAEMVDAETGRKGVPLFVPAEIRRLAGCDPDQVEQVLMVKHTFPGATVMAVLDGEVPA